MPIGAGLCPAGLAAAGYGVPDPGTPLPSSILPDARTGGFQTGRMINPTTQDYVMLPDGRLQGFDTVPQKVQLALTTALGSSALPTLGVDLQRAKEKGPDFQRQMATLVANALAPLVKSGEVRLDAVLVSEPPSNPDAGTAIVQWFDRTTDTANTSAVPIGV